MAIVVFLAAMALATLSIFGTAIGSTPSFLLLAMVGFGNCGADSVLLDTTTSELGGKEDGPRVTSMVNGIGSIGGIIEGPIVAFLLSNAGWESVMFVIVISSLIPALVLKLIGRRTQEHHPLV